MPRMMKNKRMKHERTGELGWKCGTAFYADTAVDNFPPWTWMAFATLE